MKSASWFVALVPLFIAVSSHAADTAPFWGDWAGKGVYQRGSEILHCQDFRLGFRGAPTSLAFVSGRRECEDFLEPFAPLTLEQRGDTLYFADLAVGAVAPNLITVEYGFAGPDGTPYAYRLRMERRGELLLYDEERVKLGQPTPEVRSSAILRPAQPRAVRLGQPWAVRLSRP